MNAIETSQIEIFLQAVNYDTKYRILDIGGGGEGIISKLYGDKVVAIDLRENELIEIADEKSLKIVMDAADLSFIDNQFDKVTIFFSLMYMDDDIISKVIEESKRVLKPKGKIEIWGIEIPSKSEVQEDVFIAQLKVKLENSLIETGYGVGLKGCRRDVDFYKEVFLDNNLLLLKESVGDKGQFYFLLEKRA